MYTYIYIYLCVCVCVRVCLIHTIQKCIFGGANVIFISIYLFL